MTKNVIDINYNKGNIKSVWRQDDERKFNRKSKADFNRVIIK